MTGVLKPKFDIGREFSIKTLSKKKGAHTKKWQSSFKRQGRRDEFQMEYKK